MEQPWDIKNDDVLYTFDKNGEESNWKLKKPYSGDVTNYEAEPMLMDKLGNLTWCDLSDSTRTTTVTIESTILPTAADSIRNTNEEQLYVRISKQIRKTVVPYQRAILKAACPRLCIEPETINAQLNEDTIELDVKIGNGQTLSKIYEEHRTEKEIKKKKIDKCKEWTRKECLNIDAWLHYMEQLDEDMSAQWRVVNKALEYNNDNNVLLLHKLMLGYYYLPGHEIEMQWEQCIESHANNPQLWYCYIQHELTNRYHWFTMTRLRVIFRDALRCLLQCVHNPVSTSTAITVANNPNNNILNKNLFKWMLKVLLLYCQMEYYSGYHERCFAVIVAMLELNVGSQWNIMRQRTKTKTNTNTNSKENVIFQMESMNLLQYLNLYWSCHFAKIGNLPLTGVESIGLSHWCDQVCSFSNVNNIKESSIDSSSLQWNYFSVMNDKLFKLKKGDNKMYYQWLDNEHCQRYKQWKQVKWMEETQKHLNQTNTNDDGDEDEIDEGWLDNTVCFEDVKPYCFYLVDDNTNDTANRWLEMFLMQMSYKLFGLELSGIIGWEPLTMSQYLCELDLKSNENVLYLQMEWWESYANVYLKHMKTWFEKLTFHNGCHKTIQKFVFTNFLEYLEFPSFLAQSKQGILSNNNNSHKCNNKHFVLNILWYWYDLHSQLNSIGNNNWKMSLRLKCALIHLLYDCYGEAKAKTVAKEILGKDSSNARLYHCYAQLLLKCQNIKDAKKVYANALRMLPHIHKEQRIYAPMLFWEYLCIELLPQIDNSGNKQNEWVHWQKVVLPLLASASKLQFQTIDAEFRYSDTANNIYHQYELILNVNDQSFWNLTVSDNSGDGDDEIYCWNSRSPAVYVLLCYYLWMLVSNTQSIGEATNKIFCYEKNLKGSFDKEYWYYQMLQITSRFVEIKMKFCDNFLNDLNPNDLCHLVTKAVSEFPNNCYFLCPVLHNLHHNYIVLVINRH
ncbi:hypothetical protein RFI_22487 [Reticulomyxa filosa]|uniref:Uncharacterized protein n=1 Tax=Reticulomyxa filosa TaxID=46433 RepID=X6MM38_RETFI|nr:hypothetical protein RFI_22487 [Reticulomyxa filosa]|eukprot:ETO14884.1 hypothetical protein RFI_22487 [Reticulomyxa filosa]